MVVYLCKKLSHLWIIFIIMGRVTMENCSDFLLFSLAIKELYNSRLILRFDHDQLHAKIFNLI